MRRLALAFLFAVLSISHSMAQGQAEQSQQSPSAATTLGDANARANDFSVSINASIGPCDCDPKLTALSRAAAKKPLGRTTVRDLRGKRLPVTVVNDELALRLFQQLTVQRKIPFGFPEDGCFARAHEMAYLLEKKRITTVKIVASGEFNVESEKAAGGQVTWYFHIAPAFVVDNGKGRALWVTDPSLFAEPVPVKAWLDRLMENPKSKLKNVYLTTRYMYHPSTRGQRSTHFVKRIWCRRVK